jgi:hypothetical protein
MLLSAFMLSIPVAYEKHDKFVRLARALKEVRVSFILTGVGLTFSLLIALVGFYALQFILKFDPLYFRFSVTISAWTEPGCKNAKNDPNAKAKGDGFVNGLPGWCITKKAGGIFFWFAFGLYLDIPVVSSLLKLNPSLLVRFNGFARYGLAFWKAYRLPRYPIYASAGDTRRGRRGRRRRGCVAQPCPSINSFITSQHLCQLQLVTIPLCRS